MTVFFVFFCIFVHTVAMMLYEELEIQYGTQFVSSAWLIDDFFKLSLPLTSLAPIVPIWMHEKLCFYSKYARNDALFIYAQNDIPKPY
jgi:hypothetical protein